MGAFFSSFARYSVLWGSVPRALTLKASTVAGRLKCAGWLCGRGGALGARGGWFDIGRGHEFFCFFLTIIYIWTIANSIPTGGRAEGVHRDLSRLTCEPVGSPGRREKARKSGVEVRFPHGTIFFIFYSMAGGSEAVLEKESETHASA